MFGIVNYKTTFLGLAAVLTAMAHLFTSLGGGDLNTALLDLGVIWAGLGALVAKDSNVTGGNVSNKTGETVPER